jgi:hypothetical protein
VKFRAYAGGQPVGYPTDYKTMANFLSEAMAASRFPDVGGLGGIAHQIQWDYIAMTDLLSAYGMELRVWLEGDVPLGGTFATATFECLSVVS